MNFSLLISKFVIVVMGMMTVIGTTLSAATSDSIKTNPAVRQAQAILDKYWESDSVYMQVEKKVVTTLLDIENTSSGRLMFVKGQVRIDFNEPDEQIVVINKSHIWLAKHTTSAQKKIWQVTRMPRTRAEKQNALMALLFGDKKVWDKLKLEGVSEKGDLVSIKLKPLKPEYLPGIEKLVLIIDKAVNELRLIKQWDEIESEVQMKFTTPLFDAPYEKNFFDYSPPKGAQVTEL
ncbi:MAG: outer membrane lipoprotein carrier protein LolA [Bdellovibrionales bacterium]